MKVEILESGTQARELNPFSKKPIEREWHSLTTSFLLAISEWKAAEEKRKVYEIYYAEKSNGIAVQRGYGGMKMIALEPGTIHEAQLLENGKIRITD